MEQYSSFCVNAVVLTLGGVDIEDGVPGREQVECGRKEVEEGETQERETQGTTNERSNTKHHGGLEDGMKRALRHFEPWLVLSHAVSVHTIRRAKCMRKNTCEAYLSTWCARKCMRPGSWVAAAKRPAVTARNAFLSPWTGCDNNGEGCG